jgi:hypothetical protein
VNSVNSPSPDQPPGPWDQFFGRIALFTPELFAS